MFDVPIFSKFFFMNACAVTLESSKRDPSSRLVQASLLALTISCVGAQTPDQVRLSFDESHGWQVKFASEGGACYRLQTSPSLCDSWSWTGSELIASESESGFPVAVQPDTERMRFWRVARLIHRIAFVGDSITDSTSGYQVYAPPIGMPRYMFRSYSGYAAAILGQAFTPTLNPYAFWGPTSPDWDFGWGGIRAANYLTSDVNALSSGGDKYPGIALTPVQAAIASNPDAFVVLIGTNDIPGASAAVVTDRIAAVLDVLRATGKLVFCGTLLPRIGVTAAPTVEPVQTRIDAVNAALTAVCEERNVTLVRWHEALMTGNVQNPVYFGDATHPNSGGHSVMGAVLAEKLRPYMGSEFTLPPKDDARWATANPFMDVDAENNGKADGFSFNHFSSNDLSLETEQGVVWQRCIEPVSLQSESQFIYAPAIPPARRDALAASKTPLRVACRYEIVSGDVGGVGISVVGKTGSSVSLYSGYYRAAYYDGPLVHHKGLMVTGPFLIPEGTTEFTVTLENQGGINFRIRQFGVFEAP